MLVRTSTTGFIFFFLITICKRLFPLLVLFMTELTVVFSLSNFRALQLKKIKSEVRLSLSLFFFRLSHVPLKPLLYFVKGDAFTLPDVLVTL
jgi:hypothetical protein